MVCMCVPIKQLVELADSKEGLRVCTFTVHLKSEKLRPTFLRAQPPPPPPQTCYFFSARPSPSLSTLLASLIPRCNLCINSLTIERENLYHWQGTGPYCLPRWNSHQVHRSIIWFFLIVPGSHDPRWSPLQVRIIKLKHTYKKTAPQKRKTNVDAPKYTQRSALLTEIHTWIYEFPKSYPYSGFPDENIWEHP
jgi:hypothetical protein